MTRLERRRQRVCARVTALLDRAEYPRLGPAFWSDETGSYCVEERGPGGAPIVRYLGPGSLMAIQSARRLVWISGEGRRERAHERAREALGDVVAAVAPGLSILSKVVPKP